ncbi:class I SAM-dependent methyltransferase [Paenibacillus phocaensis]|uniref:class I SAM-dependent methyltransferase n=1 Tax=Paenibacillus phocaensis TaxID=1776378 RepID=UPI000839BE56|nr:class I SAM-dependent methyltransferase [Paenibacillus phocaensis]
MSSYWDRRFAAEGMIWGELPSRTVYHASDVFQQNNINTVLVPGSGYGRNTKALSSRFQVDGIEITPNAIRLAREWDTNSHFIEGSVLDPLSYPKVYDAVYCFDVLHLFLEKERKQLIHHCYQHLRAAGLMYFTCFSDEDPHCGIGRVIEENTYEYLDGKYAHFFTAQDLADHFAGMEIYETGSVVETLTYGDQRTKKYRLRYIIVKKDGNH